MDAASPAANDGCFKAVNEPVLTYAPGTPERALVERALREQADQAIEIPLVIDGQRVASAVQVSVTAPHDHGLELAKLAQATVEDVLAATAAAVSARHEWSRRSLQERAAVFLKAADLLSGPWRQRLNAATMLGQGKTVQQAEIDSACELIDFLRFNVQFAQDILAQQPISTKGVRNTLDYRPLEGFVYAVTPFNFTAIGGNLPTAPALMGNTVVWKPAGTAALSNYLFVELLEEAGLPPGVINFVPGDPVEITNAVLGHSDFAGLHFTGSTSVFDQLWLRAAEHLRRYRNYPRLVGETGGKDFVIAHASADVEALAVGLVRGAFEYQGQKCSAASRAYIPASLWPTLRNRLSDLIGEVRMGDVRDFGNFMSAVIDRKAFDRIAGRLDSARKDAHCRIVAGGEADSRAGYFIHPTVIEVMDAGHPLMKDEIFGPVLAVNVYTDARWQDVLDVVDQTSPYALTGSVFAQDRRAIEEADVRLRFAAGNFYVNDKPTGAVVGQQPFGGARRSGTNDKAGSSMNLMRWVSARTIKETQAPARDYRYPHMG